jgi:molecular chaperone DnaK (HSP70)
LSGADDLAICDFGARLDVTVIRRSGDRLAVVGRPAADEFGGDDLDERLMDLLADRAYEADPRMWNSLAGAPQPEPPPQLGLVRNRVTQARETLSGFLHTDITVPGYSAAFRVTRREFEAAAKPDFTRMAALAETAITMAGLTPTSLPPLALAGAVSRTPAVSDVLASRFGVLPWVTADPKVAVAHGALLAGAASDLGADGRSARPSSRVQHYRVFDPDNDDWLNT